MKQIESMGGNIEQRNESGSGEKVKIEKIQVPMKKAPN